MGKARLCQELPQEHAIWAISETHLSKEGINKFKQELRFGAPRFQFHAGFPTPLKAQGVSAIGGTHKGVGFLATCPGRSLPSPWNPVVWESSRVHTSVFKMGHQWVTLGVCYGFAYKANTVSVQAQTEELLIELTARVVDGAVGPRAILGDFNQEYGVLQQCKVWEELGWVELQQYAKQQWQRELTPTCKHTSCKDQVWISPELRQHLVGVEVDSSYFADHAVLWGRFQGMSSIPPTPVWPTPKPLPKCKNDLKHFIRLPELTFDPEEDYSSAIRAFENAIDCEQRAQQMPGLTPCQRGRAQRAEVQWITQEVAPQKCPRRGEFQAKFYGRHLAHTRMLRQVRRLQSLGKLLGSSKWTSDVISHRLELWEAIQAAPGFPRGFKHWCLAEFGLTYPTLFPWPGTVPSAQYVAVLSEALQATFRALENALINSRRTDAKRDRASNPALIFI